MTFRFATPAFDCRPDARSGGNSVELPVHNAFFDAMFRAIGHATQSVDFETFSWKEGRLGTRLADARQRYGWRAFSPVRMATPQGHAAAFATHP